MHEEDHLSFKQPNRRRIFVSHQTIRFQLDDATGIKRERYLFKDLSRHVTKCNFFLFFEHHHSHHRRLFFRASSVSVQLQNP